MENLNNTYAETKTIAKQKASILVNDMFKSTSIQYALIDNGKIVLSGNAGVYSKENNKAVTADNMYGIGSISKMFVTAAVMKLVDERKVKLDAPVTKYIKEFKMKDDGYKKITVRMLLNHSSGLMDFNYFNAAITLGVNDTYNHDTFLKRLKPQRLKAEPGAYSVYCNDGFTIAEILVERVTGVNYTKYITNNITDILKISNTKTPASEFDRDKLVKTYFNEIPNALPVENVNVIGPGGLYSSAEDLCVFATTFTKNSNGILSEEALKTMENSEYLRGIWTEDTDNTIGFGLGWDSVNLYPFNQYNIKALSKSGDTPLYHGNFIVLPEQNMAMAVLSSGGNSMIDELMTQEVLLAALKEKGVIRSIIQDKTFTSPQKIAAPLELKKYEGLYASPVGYCDIKIDETGTLNLSYLNGPMVGGGTQAYDYTKDGNFVSSNGLKSLKFVKESNGKIYLQETEYKNTPDLGQSVSNLYTAQKEDANTLAENVAKAWAKRNGKKYYLLNEKYTSPMYIIPSCPKVQVDIIKGIEGYFNGNKIVDKNLAVAILDGPGMMSRSQQDYRFYTKDKVEYLISSAGIFEEESAMKVLSIKNKFICSINKDGHAKWYKIGDELADREISVGVPPNGAFVVYDSKDAVVNDSLITGVKSVKLPQNGKIVFVGSPQAKFIVKYESNAK